MASKKPAQKWEVGHKVRIGGNQYLVTGFGPPRAKGEARVTMLSSLDRTKDYEWVPFAGGLTLVRGDLVRPARAARRKAERAAQSAEREAAAAAERAAAWLANPNPPTPPPPAAAQLTAEEVSFSGSCWHVSALASTPILLNRK